MSATSDQGPVPTLNAGTLSVLRIEDVIANERNPRLDFPQDELDKLSGSIDLEGVLVPIVVFPKDGKYVLVDGERRYRCARDLGHESIPALITSERTEREVLQQMFNIHLIREPWRDMPTAKALQTLSEEIVAEGGDEPTDRELRDLTGLSIERVRQLRYVVSLPEDWQAHIRDGSIPLNFFWELKRNVLDPLKARRPAILQAYGEDKVSEAFVQKRLDQVITDTVSLRNVAPIINYAAQDAASSEDGTSDIDQAIRDLIEQPNATIDDAYEDTVQMMVEVDKLGRRTASMVAAFRRLTDKTAGTPDFDQVVKLGRDMISELSALLGTADQ